MGAPTYDAETLAAYFQPVHRETWEDPIVGPVLRRLAQEAPQVIEAVADVDRSLIFDALAWTPAARLARALDMAAFIERTREALGRADRFIDDTEAVPFHERTLRVLGLRRLIQAKAAAGRPKDHLALPLLIATLEASKKPA